MIWLIISGVIALVTGIVILAADMFFIKVSAVTDKVVVDVDKVIRPYRVVIGWLLLLATIILAYAAFAFPGYWQMHFVWPVALVFGLLFVAMPAIADMLSKYANVLIFPTKERLRGFYKIVGTILIIAGAYILVTAYLVR
jgi:uncharacterized membrane protein HdeD (DUF308 family)